MNHLTSSLPSFCKTKHNCQSPLTPTAVSQSCLTEKFDQGFQNMYFHEDIESSLSIEKKTNLQPGPKIPLLKYRNRCVQYYCCCYCLCLPKWARYAVWSFVLIFLLVTIVLGSIFATFKMPTFDIIRLIHVPSSSSSSSSTMFTSSSLTVANGKFSYHFGLQVNVDNPNIFPLHFSKMNATAYYPSSIVPYLKIPIGGGYLLSQWIPAKTKVTFKYPFHIDYDPSLDADQNVLSSLTDKCGLTGNQPQNLSIDYSIQLAVSALLVTVHPVISSSAQFPCPIDLGMLQQGANSAFMQGSISTSMLSTLK